MKKIFSLFLVAATAASSLLMTGCIEETTPEGSTVTEEMLTASTKATEAMLWGMPAKLYAYNEALGRSFHYDWGYGSIMHIRDVMTEEYAVANSSYDWYDQWENNYYLGENYAAQQLVWQTFYKQILPTNQMIDALADAELNDAQKGYLASAYAFRAFNYLDLARMFEFLPNDGTDAVNADGNDVTGITVPIVTNETTEEIARNNPRQTHYAMFDFIMSDLDKAEADIDKMSMSEKTVPSQGVVYALKARAYLWHASFKAEADANGGASFVPCDSTGSGYANAMSSTEAYQKAKEYAQKAIDLGVNTPLSQSEWLNKTAGFNEINTSSWMLGMSIPTEADCVQTGIINWTSWCSNEAKYGYAAAGPFVMIGKSIYDKINDSDFRKLSYKAPEDGALYNKSRENAIETSQFDNLPTYSSLKIRPADGNTTEYSVGSATCVPMMRIEEMYFIVAECDAQLGNPAQAKAEIESFMQTYRDPSYQCLYTSKDAVIEEIFLQKRIEFWGEGISYFDYKPVTRVYADTNFKTDAQFNTTTRPAWMNFCIVRSEISNNNALQGWNNPDPSDCYTSGVGAKSRAGRTNRPEFAQKLTFKKF